MVGKPPHRPAGKARSDEEHRAALRAGGAPFDARGALDADDLATKERVQGEPSTVMAEEPIGGSRPGVPSRVREAIENRMEREND